MMLTYVLLHLAMRILSNLFNWMMGYLILHGEKEIKPRSLIEIANSQDTGMLRSIKLLLTESKIPLVLRIIIFTIALVGSLELIIGLAINTTTIPGSLSITSEKFNADPLNPCVNEEAGGCPELLQSKFRFQWLQGASDVMVNGISKQLSMHWGDLVDGERVVMVATTDNDTNINYRVVQTENQIIPAFSLSTMCYDTPETYPILGSEYYRNLNIPKPTPLFELIQTIQAGTGLEGRWMGEIIKLEQDNLNETTRITLNFVHILPINSSCDGNFDIAGNLEICRPTKGLQISCLMNTHVEYVEYISAGCDTCFTRGISGNRVDYSSPKPVYSDFIHESLASYGGHILLPICDTVNFGGCLALDTNDVNLVMYKFIELLRGITASGVLARRILLSGIGKEMPVQLLIKGETGVRLEFGGGYWITILIMSILCFLGVVGWQFIKYHKGIKGSQIPQISIEWLIFQVEDSNNLIRKDKKIIVSQVSSVNNHNDSEDSNHLIRKDKKIIVSQPSSVNNHNDSENEKDKGLIESTAENMSSKPHSIIKFTVSPVSSENEQQEDSTGEK
ncbi:hypothetical protein RclHR1_01690014 [Rhizophagus clarus]|nr:hypothetical protein RclHR1_01690014 [Rhizophagus clarus]